MQFHPESAGGPLDTIEVSILSTSQFWVLVDIAFFQMFTDFVNECGSNTGISAMIADEVKVGGSDAKVAATA